MSDRVRRLFLLFGLLLIVASLGGGAYLLLGPAPVPPGDGALIALGEASPREGEITEFSTYGCPHCRRYALQVFPRLYHNLVETGKVRYRIRLLTVYPGDSLLNRLSYCAYRRSGEAFLEFRQGVLDFYSRLDPGSRSPEDLAFMLLELGLADGELLDCAHSPAALEQEARDEAMARRLSISATPTLFVGRKRLLGFRTYEEVVRMLPGVVE